MPTTPRRSSARCSPKVTTRSIRRKRPTWCSTTLAAFATRPNQRSSAACRISSRRRARARSSGGKAFYLETFGCQMNAHDSEKVVGTLLAKGYSQVETTEEAHLVLYNTCSIRDKAEQKVFSRLQNFKR